MKLAIPALVSTLSASLFVAVSHGGDGNLDRFQGFDQLYQEVNSGVYQPRTCVASLILNENENGSILYSIQETFRKMGFKAYTQPGVLFDFKLGLKGLDECLTGPYEDVTIISHGAKGSGILMKEDIVADPEAESGETIIGSKVPPHFFKRYYNGRSKVSQTLRQITLIVCNTESSIHLNRSLRRIIRENGLNLKVQPYDLEAYIEDFFRNKIRTHHLLGYMVFENAQPEWFPRLVCIVRSKLTVVWESGSNFCVRGRYKVEIQALGFGSKESNQMVFIEPRSLEDELEDPWKTLDSAFDLELSLRGTLRINPNPANPVISNLRSYGVGLGIARSVDIRSNRFCYDSNQPLVRLACFESSDLLKQEFLKSNGESVNKRDHLGRTALQVSVTLGNSDVVDDLLAHGANPNLANSRGMNSLHLAVRERRVFILRSLLSDSRFSIDFNATESEGANTPLHLCLALAWDGRYLSLCKDLIRADEHEIDFLLRNGEGKTYQDILSQFQNSSEARELRDLLRRYDER